MAPTNPFHRPNDPQTLAELKAAIKGGLHPRSAAASIGIPESTFYDWKQAHPAFAAAINEAIADLKAELAGVVKASALGGNWAAAMTLLERLYPDEYGRRDRVQHAHAGQVRLAITPAQLSMEEALALADMEARIAGAERLALPSSTSDWDGGGLAED